ncbi:phosphoribosylformylglycinamidine synthase subunit PurQ [Gimesia sp.]|uniref:phosphoribosylformylglycinamidine synthase subunit PurQ n=1 Tax=Gimesia sp. TaxID=2024833 RepID=UPI003A8D6241
MSTPPQVCVLRAPGTNCDIETAHAFDLCGAESTRIHLLKLLENPSQLNDYQILCLPGGFSYGDDVGAGVIFASHLQGQLAEVIGNFLAADKLVLGICNGFQVLLKAGILPGGATGWPPQADQSRDATLTWNNNGKYTSLWVNLGVVAPQNVFLKGIDQIELPIAHAEGRIAVSDPAIVEGWKANLQVAMCYRAPGEEPMALQEEILSYPVNPNGSAYNIAALSDPAGRVLGLMPHPERFLFATQHPQWTRLGLTGEGAGMQLFRNAVNYFE